MIQDENIKKLEQSIDNLKSKLSKIYFIVQDTKNNPKASIRYIYQMAMSLKNAGYNPIILHEKAEYTGVSEWLDPYYMENLPHRPIEGQNLEIAPEDLIVVPEIYGFIMEQIEKLPCGKIVLSQCYDYLTDTLQPGHTWNQFGFIKCITTSESQKNYISNIMRNISFDIIEPVISDCFEKQVFPPKPIIAVHTRDQRDAVNLIKSFYLKFPQYRWITFRDIRGLSEKEMAKSLQDSFLSVWIDPISSFGTFPLESMKVGVPVIGKTPNLLHSWLNEDNGIWIPNPINVVDIVADFIQNWLEDNINPSLYEGMEKTVSEYSNMDQFNQKVTNTFREYLETRLFSFEQQLSKLTETIEN